MLHLLWVIPAAYLVALFTAKRRKASNSAGKDGTRE
jgi:hypothetical protein